MADLVVGLAKTVVLGAIGRAQSVIDEDARQRQSVQRNLVFITGEFDMMHSFLSVTTTEGVENKVMMTWVRQVRELAYDLEDFIEIVAHLDTKTSWWCYMIPSCMLVAAHPLDSVVHDIEQLRATVEDVSTRNTRYSLMSGSGSKPVITPHQPASPDSASLVATAFNMLVEARDAARRQQGLGDLTQLITNKDYTDDPPLQVISVWGTGGDLGMTSIIRKAYNDPEIRKNFACRSWVKLMHPFDPREFVYANNCAEQGAYIGAHVLAKMEASQDDLLKEFLEEVNSKTYLVVLENLTDMVDWDAVRTFLPDMKNGSWIIVSTQQFEIASLCIGHSYQPLELKQFSPEHSVCAFFKENSQEYRNKEGKPIVCEVSPNLCMEKIPSREAVDEWMKNYPLVGRETQLNELRGHTAKARFSDSPVISVWGIAGIGKSALVRNMYYDRMLNSVQFNKYRWVDVSHPFNLRDFSRSLLSDYHSEKDPIKECRELLSQHNCLIVIDDLKSKDEWDLIKAALVSTHSSSVIIVITTEACVATYCANNEGQVLNVKGLGADAAMDLFRKEVKRKNRSCPLHNHRYELEELMFKCGGIPRVIVATAALLAMRTVTLMDTIQALNIRFMHHLETNLEYNSLRGLFGWMNSSYFRDCPDSLKPCIFYLSIFPLEYNIRRRRLVRRWIAEGYCRDSDKKSADEQGEEFFTNLLELSMVQQIPQLVTTATNGIKIVVCQVNGFVCEYIVSRRMEENLVCELGPNCVLTVQRTGRHLIILRDWDRDKIMFESIDFSRLRSMTVYGKWESFFISRSMRLLRVLDLEDAVGVNDEDLEKMVKQLCRLKFLSLRGCSEVFHLPNSLGDLRQLQTLDVRHTSIVTLPESIGKLQNLQYIRAGNKLAICSRLPGFHRGRALVGVKVPRAIGKMRALHTLGVVNVGVSGGNTIVEEIKKLTQLRKIGLSGINKHNSKLVASWLQCVHLESLLVQLDKDSQGCLDDISLPWDNLQSLRLYGLQDKLPLSRNPLSKLRKLDLGMDTLHKDAMDFLGNLPELSILRLHVKQLHPEDGKLHFYAERYGEELGTFKKVKLLQISCRSSTLHITFGSRSMKSLELLKIDWSSAIYQLTGLNELFELKEVLLMGTRDEAIKTNLESELASHPKDPVVKLEELRCWF